MLRRLLSLCALLVALPALARADVYVEPVRVRVRHGMQLANAYASTTNAPAEDTRRVREEVVSSLARAAPRLARCLEAVDLREDPLRGPRARQLVGTMRFARSERPQQVRFERANGIPPGAITCVREAIGTVSVRPAPRGEVTVRFVYRIGPY